MLSVNRFHFVALSLFSSSGPGNPRRKSFLEMHGYRNEKIWPWWPLTETDADSLTFGTLVSRSREIFQEISTLCGQDVDLGMYEQHVWGCIALVRYSPTLIPLMYSQADHTKAQ